MPDFEDCKTCSFIDDSDFDSIPKCTRYTQNIIRDVKSVNGVCVTAKTYRSPICIYEDDLRKE